MQLFDIVKGEFIILEAHLRLAAVAQLAEEDLLGQDIAYLLHDQPPERPGERARSR